MDDQALSEPVTVEIADTATGATVAGVDYTAFPPTTVVFPAGSVDGGATQSGNVNVLADTIAETDKTVVLRLTTRSGPVAFGTRLVHPLIIKDYDGVPPEAKDDWVDIHTKQPITINIIDNDTDPDGSLRRFIADFDGVNDSISWDNLGLDGASALS